MTMEEQSDEKIPVAHLEGRLESHYEVLKAVGKGGYAIVHKAKRRADDATVAIKRVDVFDMPQRKRTRCLQEVKLFQNLNSEHVVRMHEAFIDQNQLIIVFEWAAGGDLKRLIRKAAEAEAPLQEAHVWRLFLQCVQGVKYLHTQRIMHRDIKPANVMVTAAGKLKLGDLGLGREFSETSFNEGNKLFSKVGTPYYVSPEVVKGGGYDWQSDVWSLGCLLYELAQLKSPFEVQGANLYDVFQKISKCDYPPLSKSTWSRSLISLQEGMLQLDPQKRPNIDEIVRFCEAMVHPSNPADIDLSVVSQSICDRLIILSLGSRASDKMGSSPSVPKAALQIVHTTFFSHADIRPWHSSCDQLQFGVLLSVVAWLLRLNFRREDAVALERCVTSVEASGKQRPYQADAAVASVPYALAGRELQLHTAQAMISAAEAIGVDTRSVKAEGLLRGFGASVCALLDMLLMITERKAAIPCAAPMRSADADRQDDAAPAARVDLQADMAWGANKGDGGMACVGSESVLSSAELTGLLPVQAPLKVTDAEEWRSNDAEAWYLETEELAPHLAKIVLRPADVVHRGWSVRLEEHTLSAHAIAGLADTVAAPLQRLCAAVGNDLDTIERRQAALTAACAAPLVRLQQARNIVDRCTRTHAQLVLEASEAAQSMMQIGESLEELNAEIEERQTMNAHTGGCVELIAALERLKKDIRDMDVQMGVIQHQLLKHRLQRCMLRT